MKNYATTTKYYLHQCKHCGAMWTDKAMPKKLTKSEVTKWVEKLTKVKGVKQK